MNILGSILRNGRAAWLFCFLLATTMAFAQPQLISVSLVLMAPYPMHADEVLDMGDNTLISIQNNDPFQSYTVYLSSVLDGNNGVNIRTRPEARPTTPIELAPGASMMLSGTELQAFYNNYSENDLLYSGISLEQLINDNTLPEGVYTLCITAHDFLTGLPLSGTAPQGCSAPFVVITADPPIITSPTQGQAITATDPTFFNITWIPPTVSVSDLVYRLDMMDITGLPINPYDAFLTGNMLQLSEQDLPFNSFLYGMEYPQLQNGHEYAVRVRAYRQFGSLNILNDGWSDVVVFTYGTPGAADPWGDGDGTTTDTPVDPGGVTLTEGNTTGTYDCASPCAVTLPPATELKQELRVGDLVRMGHFEMAITQATGTGTFTGEGVILPTGYLPIGIKVTFSGLKVNGNGAAVAGEAEAVIRTDSWIDATWADLSTNVRNVRFSRNHDRAWQQATDPQWYVDQGALVVQNTGSTLPFSIGPESRRLQMVGMHFFPGRASFNMAYIERLADDLEEPRYLSFLGKDFCLTPGGPAVGEDQAVLQLMETVNYKMTEELSIAFDPANTLGAGTRATFDCDGLVQVDVQGRAIFSPKLFKPVNSTGNTTNDTLYAAFAAQYVEWSDWQATLDFRAMGTTAASVQGFQYKELEGYTFQVQQAYIDHSVSANLQGMNFPQNHPGAQTPEWQGVYLERVQVTLPTWAERSDTVGHRTSFMGRDLVIDDSGFSGRFSASGVLPRKSGKLDKWNFSIDNVEFEILASSLVGGSLSGRLHLPIAEDDLNYVATVDYAGTKTLHSFELSSTNESLEFDVWAATFIMGPNCGLAITVGSGVPLIKATLNGRISFAPTIGHIDKNNLTDISIEDLVISNRPNYISLGHIGTGLSPATLAVAGFAVVLNELDYDASDLQKAKLIMDIGMDLSKGVMPISGSVGLFIKNKIDIIDSLQVTREGTEITSIHIEAEVSGVKMKGGVAFFSEDEKFGSGFEGALNLTFLDATTVQGNVLYGNMTDGTTYWFAFGMVGLSTPFPLATPLDLYAFGGGAYWNMEMNDVAPNPRTLSNADVSARDFFNVKKGKGGIQASVVVGLTPSSTTFNADATLTVQFNTDGGLNIIKLNGNGYVMQDIKSSDPNEAMVSTTFDVDYNFSTNTFSAGLTLVGNIPKAAPIFEVSGGVSIYRSPTLWYFKAGTPAPEEIIHLGLDVWPLTATAGAYFMTGQQLPPPILPAEVSEFFDGPTNTGGNLAQGLGIGFMAGAHIHAKGDFTLVGTGMTVDVLCGADVSMMNYEFCTCNGNADFGVNKWYAMGRVYLIGGARLSAFTADVASIKVGVMVEAQFPNPNYVHGRIKAEAEILWWTEDIDEDFTLGTPCDIQPLPNAGLMVERQELELESVDMISGITPAPMSSFVALTERPVIHWNVGQGEEREYVYADGIGGLIEKKYRFSLSAKWLRQNDEGTFVVQNNYMRDDDAENNTWTMRLVTPSGAPSQMNGSRGYKVRAEAEIQEWKSTGWEVARYTTGAQAGQPIREVLEHFFTTTTSLTEFDLATVDYTKPYPRQRFLPYSDLQQGIIKFNTDQQPRFNDFNTCGFDLFMRMDRVDGQGTPVEVPVNTDYELKVFFDMPSLQAETIYDISIVARREATPTQLSEETRPNCQLRPATLQELIPEVVNLPNGQEYASVNLSNYAGMQQYSGIDVGAVQAALGIETPIVQEKILHTIYFRTSKYPTATVKLKSIRVGEITAVSASLPHYRIAASTATVKDFRISLTGDEGFDLYDLKGAPFVESGSFTSPVYTFASDHCNANDVYGSTWSTQVCAEIYGLLPTSGGEGGGGATLSGSGRGGQLGLVASNVEGLRASLPSIGTVQITTMAGPRSSYKNMAPLLSDAEVGLSGASSSGSNYSGLTLPVFGSSPPPFMLGGDRGAPVLLELIWRPERAAYEALTLIQKNAPTIFKPAANYLFPRLPNGNYPLYIGVSNMSSTQEETSVGSRTLQLNIQ